MADNTTLNTGSGGDVIATDDIAGVKYQRVKLTLGADGVNDGDVASGNALPVDGSGVTQPVSAAALPLPSGAATEATLLAIQGAQLPDGHNVTVDNASIAITAAALPLPTGAATAANQLADNHNVTVSNFPASQTVDGTVTANLSATDNAVLDAIAASAAAIEAGQLADGHNVTIDNTTLAITNDDTISTNNSTTSPLGNGATFTGTGDDVSDFATVTCQLYADEGSATDGMTFQFSTDNSNWDDVYSFTMAGGETRRFQFPVCAQYFRIVYTNGATPQAAFRVQTLLKRQNTNTSIHRIEDNVSTDRSATLVKAGLIAQVNGTGDFIPIQANAGGILKVGGSVDVDDISAGTQTNDVKVTLDGETVTIGAAIPAGDNNIGNVDVVTLPALPAGSNNIGDVDIASAIPAGTNAIGDVGLEPRTSGGTSIMRSLDLDETEEAVKASAGQVYWIMAFNLATSVRYLKFYNATVASVTVGTTTPVLTIPIPTQNASANGAGLVLAIPHGIEFDTAITVAATTGVADADTGAPGANEVIVNIGYA
jgi:hypothetical protein